MNNTFTDEFNILNAQINELHDLTVTTCDMCGGSYAENLDGAVGYFAIGGKRFKITVAQI